MTKADPSYPSTNRLPRRLIIALLLLLGCAAFATYFFSFSVQQAYHVYPGEDIQAALDRASVDPSRKRVIVHAGTYRPTRHRQALIAFNRQHDGIILESEGDVTLTAANPELAKESDEGYPAVVNHVVYFGDGISPTTKLRGFKITGANNHVIFSEDPNFSIQPDVPGLEKHKLFFYADGGGILSHEIGK